MLSLKECIEKGLKDDAADRTREAVEEQDPLEIINGMLIPALNHGGRGIRKGAPFSSPSSS